MSPFIRLFVLCGVLACNRSAPVLKLTKNDIGPNPTCRPNGILPACDTKPGLGPQNGNYLEGEGLETLHFTAPTFPPADDTVLVASSACGSATDLVLRVAHCEPEDLGAAGCSVHVEKGNGICRSDVAGEADGKRYRGVMAVRGQWDKSGAWDGSDQSVLTFACDNTRGRNQLHFADGAITKCLARYAPAKGPEVRDRFLACIRATRGDYCGDGMPHTNVGVVIDIHDNGGNQMTQPECAGGKRLFEASWSKAGAVCLARPRFDKVEGHGDSAIVRLPSCRSDFKTPSKWGYGCRLKESEEILFTRSRCNLCPEGDEDCSGPDLDPACQARQDASRPAQGR